VFSSRIWRLVSPLCAKIPLTVGLGFIAFLFRFQPGNRPARAPFSASSFVGKCSTLIEATASADTGLLRLYFAHLPIWRSRRRREVDRQRHNVDTNASCLDKSRAIVVARLLRAELL
jgi:hypothetical protein